MDMPSVALKPNLVGWCPEENKRLLLELIRAHDVKTVIEVGCFVGLATVLFAQHCDHVTAIDTFEAKNLEYLGPQTSVAAENQYDQLMANLYHYEVADKVTVLKVSSLEAVEHYPLMRADMVYIDASHVYEDVKADIAAWLPRAKKVLCGDDYTPTWPGVKKAVNEVGVKVNTDSRVWFCVVAPERG